MRLILFAALALSAAPHAQVQRLDKPDGPGWATYFGQSTYVDAGRLAVGTPFDYQTFDQTGSAFIYRDTPEGWADPVKLVPDLAAREFGASVALDGSTLVVGAPGTQAAYVYEDGPAGWALADRLAACDTTGGRRFGHKVVMNAAWLAVSSVPPFGLPDVESGTVCVYRRTPAGLTLSAFLRANETPTQDQFGTFLALDGDRLAVVAPGRGREGDGDVYVYTYDSGSWTQEAHFTPTGAATGFVGGVALLGATLIVGNINDGQPFQAGAAYVYSLGTSGWDFSQRLTAPVRRGTALFGAHVSLDKDLLAVSAARDGVVDVEGFVYAFPRRADGFASPVRLGVPNSTGLERLGASSVLVTDREVMAATIQGDWGASLYVFDRSSYIVTTEGELPTRSPLLIYPNPVRGAVALRLSSPFAGLASVRLTDVLGRKVFESEVALNAGPNEFSISVPGISAGIYTVTVESGGTLQRGRMTVIE